MNEESYIPRERGEKKRIKITIITIFVHNNKLNLYPCGVLHNENKTNTIREVETGTLKFEKKYGESNNGFVFIIIFFVMFE